MSTILTTASGREVDLLRPAAADIDFGDVAEHLCREARYNGATRGPPYSVAQHLVLCADAVHLLPEEAIGNRQSAIAGTDTTARCPPPTARERSSSAPFATASASPPPARVVAAYVLAHDFHEAYLKDDPTPKKRALDALAAAFGAASGVILEQYARLTERFDQAIHDAAGLAWPPPPAIARAIASIDRSMLVTEWRDLRPGIPLPEGYRGVAPLPIRIAPWGWEEARGRLEARMRQLLPALAGTSGADLTDETRRRG